MKDFERIRDIKRAVEASLFALSGVHAVGVGLKMVGGKFTEDPAIIVYVVKKMPLSELRPEEVIPAVVQGTKTDVFETEPFRLHAAPTIAGVVTGNLKPSASSQSVTVVGAGFTSDLTATVTSPGGGTQAISSVNNVLPNQFRMSATLASYGTYQLQIVEGSGTSNQLSFDVSDTTTYATLVGGIQVTMGGNTPQDTTTGGFTEGQGVGEQGTLGCFARSGDTPPRIFAVTCHHVAASPLRAQKLTLTVTVDATKTQATIGGTNSAGSLIILAFIVASKTSCVFYRTDGTETLDQLASKLQGLITGLGVSGLSAGVNPGGVVTITGGTFRADSKAFSPPAPNPLSSVTASVNGPTIAVQGNAPDLSGVYVWLNKGGTPATYGAFVEMHGYDNANTIASNIALVIGGVVTRVGPDLSGVTATASGATVQVSGLQDIECNVSGDIRVGHPTNSFSSNCSACCSDRIGVVFDTRANLDVALVQLDAGTKYKPEIQDIGPINDTLDVTAQQPGYRLQKRGVASGRTTGTLHALDVSVIATDSSDSGDPTTWKVLSGFVTGAFSIYSSNNNLPFSQSGDSGSAVVTNPAAGASDADYNKIVGILFGGNTTATIAMPIGPIVTAFSGINLQIVTTKNTPDVQQVVPKTAAMAPRVLTAADGAMLDRLQRVQSEIESTPAGKRYGELVQKHLLEADRLVNTNPRVAAIWRRDGGPEIVRGVLRAVQQPGYALPSEIDGKPLEECLDRIQGAFLRYCSDPFAADLKTYGPSLAGFAGMSYAQLLDALKQHDAVP